MDLQTLDLYCANLVYEIEAGRHRLSGAASWPEDIQVRGCLRNSPQRCAICFSVHSSQDFPSFERPLRVNRVAAETPMPRPPPLLLRRAGCLIERTRCATTGQSRRQLSLFPCTRDGDRLPLSGAGLKM